MAATSIPIYTDADLQAIMAGTNPVQGAQGIRSVSEVPSIYDIQLPRIEFIVPDLLARSSVTVLTGESGSGKTTFITALASAVSQGGEFAGKSTIKSPVLYLDRENTAPVVRERLERLGVRDGNNYKYWGGWVAGGDPPPLDSPVIAEYITESEPKPLIVVDSLIAFHPGSENDSSETRRFLDQARKLSNSGAAVVILHHTGKGENTREYRGSSDIKGSVDICYRLTNSGTSKLEQVRLANFKSRFSVASDLVFQYVDGKFHLLKENGSVIFSPFHDNLTQLLATNPGINTGEFEKLAGSAEIPRKDARHFLSIGVRDGFIHQEDKGSRTKTYTLANPPDTNSDLVI